MTATTELRLATAFLTRLPAAPVEAAPDTLSRAVWAFPLVGAGLGLAGGLVFALADGLGLAPLLAATLAIAALVLATGALHEDGLADLADGLGGASPERALEIMRDSRIGSYGVLALVLTMVARIGAVAAIAEPGAVIAVLVGAEALSRGWLAPIMARARPARADGLAADAGRPPSRRAVLAAGIGALIALVVVGGTFGLGAALVVLAASGIAAALLARHAQKRLGGITGDVLGACQQFGLIAALLVLAANA